MVSVAVLTLMFLLDENRMQMGGRHCGHLFRARAFFLFPVFSQTRRFKLASNGNPEADLNLLIDLLFSLILVACG